MNRVQAARIVRLCFVYVLLALVFTNFFSFLTGFGDSNYAAEHASALRRSGIPPYAIRDFGFLVALLVIMLDPRSLRRLFANSLFRWAFAILVLYTIGIIHRTMEAPPGMPLFDIMMPFFTRVDMLAFMVSCIVFFDGAEVLTATKRFIVLMTLLGVGLNIIDLIYPGTFSIVSGRGAGFYVNPNTSGLALTLGCLIGLPALSRYWREAFVVIVSVGVLATFSREAMLAMMIVIGTAAFARVLSPTRLVLGGTIFVVLFVIASLGQALEKGGILTTDNMNRLVLGTSDYSTAHRLDDAARTFQAFEDAPLFGQGIGTDEYWTGEPAHNLYLRLMADEGVIGLLIIPALIYSLRRKTWDFYAFAMVLLAWGMFDHFIFTSPFALLCFAIEGGEAAQFRDTLSYFNPRQVLARQFV